jgi:hypothetical protein
MRAPIAGDWVIAPPTLGEIRLAVDHPNHEQAEGRDKNRASDEVVWNADGQ